MPITIAGARTARIVAGGLVAAAAFAFTVPAASAAPVAASTPATAPVASVAIAAGTPLDAVPAAGTPLWVNIKKLKMRWGPTQEHNTRVSGYRDARVIATGVAENGRIQVKAAGLTAWAPMKYFTADKPGWEARTVGVQIRKLNFRSKPTRSADVAFSATRGTEGNFMLFVSNGRWRVKVDGKAAWTDPKYLAVGGYFDVKRVLATAHSQVGYREPAWQDNKFNDWIGNNNAWCSVFVSWVFDRADYAAGVPKLDRFHPYKRAVLDAGVVDTTPTASEIRKGDVVLIDWWPYEGPTHTGIVDHVDGGYIWLVEGNTTDGTGDDTRGVFYRKRAMVDVYGFYRPTDYALATASW